MITQLEDLPDDCLLEVLEKLFPNQLMKMRLNRRLERLATEKIRFKTKAILFDRKKPNNNRFNIPTIAFNQSSSRFFDCTHLKINSNQVLVLKSEFIHNYGRSLLWKEKEVFLTIMSRCSNVKSVDFNDFEIPDRLLKEVLQRCSKIDCIKLSTSLSLPKDNWTESLSRFRRRIFGKNPTADETNDVDEGLQNLNIKEKSPEIQLVELIAELCPNIKHVDLSLDGKLKQDFFKTVKLLPDNCWLVIHCTTLGKRFEDVVDELDVFKLSLRKIGGRVERLSSLRFKDISRNSYHEVEFAGLKKLDLTANHSYYRQFLPLLFASRFPLLEEFGFNTYFVLTDDGYDRLFQRMPSVKKLIIYYHDHNLLSGTLEQSISFYLPSASVHQLISLETIDFHIFRVRRKWKPKKILPYLDQYINVISLKKLTLKVYDTTDKINEEVRKELVKEVRRLKLKQSQVEIELFIRIKTKLTCRIS